MHKNSLLLVSPIENPFEQEMFFHRVDVFHRFRRFNAPMVLVGTGYAFLIWSTSFSNTLRCRAISDSLHAHYHNFYTVHVTAQHDYIPEYCLFPPQAYSERWLVYLQYYNQQLTALCLRLLCFANLVEIPKAFCLRHNALRERPPRLLPQQKIEDHLKAHNPLSKHAIYDELTG